jgi:hypothetical protein
MFSNRLVNSAGEAVAGATILAASVPADGLYRVRFVVMAAKSTEALFQGPTGQLGTSLRVWCGDNGKVELDLGQHLLGETNPLRLELVNTPGGDVQGLIFLELVP